MQRATLVQDKTGSRTSHRTVIQPPRVLLAENDGGLRRELTLALGRRGYEVLEAADGHAALELLGTHMLYRDAPDLIIADVRLPRCSGLALLCLVRKMSWPTPVVVITAVGDRISHTEALRLGAAAVFFADEPFDVDRLCAFAHGVVPPD